MKVGPIHFGVDYFMKSWTLFSEGEPINLKKIKKSLTKEWQNASRSSSRLCGLLQGCFIAASSHPNLEIVFAPVQRAVNTIRHLRGYYINRIKVVQLDSKLTQIYHGNMEVHIEQCFVPEGSYPLTLRAFWFQNPFFFSQSDLMSSLKRLEQNTMPAV